MQKVLSLETSKLLVEKGIRLETEKYWSGGNNEDSYIRIKSLINKDNYSLLIPVPDTIELLSELTDLNLIDYALNFNIHVTVIMRDVEKLAQCLLWVKSKEVPHVRD